MTKIAKYIEIVLSRGPQAAKQNKIALLLYDVLSKHYEKVEISMLTCEQDLYDLAAKQPDLVFLGVKNIKADDNAENIWVSSYLEEKGINFTGSCGPAMRLEFDKSLAKDAVRAKGIATAAFFVANSGDYTDESQLSLRFPLFLKPPTVGSGRGIDDNSVVHDFGAFTTKIDVIDSVFKTPTLVEEYLTGREFSVAVMRTSDGVYETMPIELITAQNEKGDSILTNKVKRDDTEERLAVVDATIFENISALALASFTALGARDYGRIDLRMDSDGTAHFLEANLMPGVSNHGYFTSAMMLNRAEDYETMIMRIVELALTRESV